jgi:hypothetical protein
MSRSAKPEEPITNTLHAMYSEAIAQLTAPEVLCAILLERKLKRAGVTLSPEDRARLKACTPKLMETGDASLLVEAVPQCQNVEITFGDEDVEEAQRVHDERQHVLT